MEVYQQEQGRTTGFYLKRIAGIILLVSLAATFLFSAYSKVYSENAFDSFQWTFLELGLNSIVVAGIIARIMIGLEFMLGLFLLGHIYLRKFTYKAILALLVVFIIYLLLVIARQGNTGNCGCFGDKLAMTPLAAIWKNAGMIVVTLALMYLYPVKPYRHQEYVTMALCLVAFSAPFVMHGVYIGTAPAKSDHELDMGLLYKYKPAPPASLKTGKHLIAFMSLTCPHCRKAAYLLQIIHRDHPELPLYIVLNGSEDFLDDFMKETHAENVPHIFWHHTEEFTQLAGPAVPAIYWVNNGKVEYQSKYAYYQLDPRYMIQWVGGTLK